MSSLVRTVQRAIAWLTLARNARKGFLRAHGDAYVTDEEFVRQAFIQPSKEEVLVGVALRNQIARECGISPVKLESAVTLGELAPLWSYEFYWPDRAFDIADELSKLVGHDVILRSRYMTRLFSFPHGLSKAQLATYTLGDWIQDVSQEVLRESSNLRRGS